MMACYL